jgi:hypothetical protein
MSNSWAVEQVIKIAGELRRHSDDLERVAEGLREDVGLGWMLPVGTEEFPPEHWYVAQRHKPDHTGLDVNLDEPQWGDVERGFPIWAIAEGVVDQVGRSDGWLGVVVVEHHHEGEPLFVRYAHLGEIFVEAGDEVVAGDRLGALGDWRTGDHLHFDMAGERFEWYEWLSDREWVDPVPVLKAHIDPAFVEAMIRRGD